MTADKDVLHAVLRSDFLRFLQKCLPRPVAGANLRAGLAPSRDRVSDGARAALRDPAAHHHSGAAVAQINDGVRALPRLALGQLPTRRIICVSYSGDLSKKFANDLRAVLDSSWYRECFPTTRIGPFKDSEIEIELTRRGLRLATSVGGTLTGRGGDIIIIDDPLKPIDANDRKIIEEYFAKVSAPGTAATAGALSQSTDQGQTISSQPVTGD